MNFLKTPASTELANLDHRHALKIAEDSDTHPDVLSQLAESKDEAVAAAVAANPNTPEAVLFLLWVKHPACLLKNPLLHLWEFTEPGSLQSKIPPDALLSLYAHLIENEAEQIPENILPVKRRMQLFDDAMKKIGSDFMGAESAEDLPFAKDDSFVHAMIDGNAYVEQKMDAMRAHATQIEVDGPFFALSNNLGLQVWGNEYYTLVKGEKHEPLDSHGHETDLFAGIAIS